MEGSEAWLLGCHMSHYVQGNRANHDPLRPRKLLLHKREIERLLGKVMEKGLTLVPLRLYFKGGRVKVELGLARGRKTLDKRHVDPGAGGVAGHGPGPSRADPGLTDRRRTPPRGITRKGAIGFDGDSEVRSSTSRAPIPSFNGGSAIAADTQLALAA